MQPGRPYLLKIGARTVTATLSYVNPNFSIGGLTNTLTIGKEDARATYTGLFESASQATQTLMTSLDEESMYWPLPVS